MKPAPTAAEVASLRALLAELPGVWFTDESEDSPYCGRIVRVWGSAGDAHWAEGYEIVTEEPAGDDHPEQRALLVGAVNALPGLLSALDAAEREKEARYDCHAGPGTTEPACGGCTSCLTRALDAAEARAVAAENGLANTREALRVASQEVFKFKRETGEWKEAHRLKVIRAETAERERDAARAALPPGAIVVADTEETVERIARAINANERAEPRRYWTDHAGRDRSESDEDHAKRKAAAVLAALREAGKH